jgi:Cu/Ag efflux protein CusF
VEWTVKKWLTTMMAICLLSGTALAGETQPAPHHEHLVGTAPAQPQAAKPSTDGVVRGVDRAARTITVEHGPIPNLGMAAMTMPYYVKDAAMLTAVKPGDKVRMSVDNLSGAYTIVALQRVQ